MKIIDVITSRFLIIFLEISENIKFSKNSQPLAVVLLKVIAFRRQLTLTVDVGI